MTENWKSPTGAIEDLEIVDVPFVSARIMGLGIRAFCFIIRVIIEACATVVGYVAEKPRSRSGSCGRAFAVGCGVKLKLD